MPIHRNAGADTLALHAGQTPDPVHHSRATPIHFTTSYVFDDSEHAAALFNQERAGHVYSRISNPTNAIRQSWLPSDLPDTQARLRWLLYQKAPADRTGESVDLWVALTQ